MAIFGVRKLRFDSNSSVNFGGDIKEGKIPATAVKYAIPEKPDKENDKKVDNPPTLKYAIPSDNYKPYINWFTPKKEDDNPNILKYAIPKN